MTKKQDILNNISRAVCQSDIPLQVLAKLIDVSPTRLANIKAGKTLPTVREFSSLCTVLHLDSNEILCLKTTKNYTT